MPRPALAYEALEHFRRYGCVPASDEHAVRRCVFNLSLGLAFVRARNGTLLTEVLRNMTVKLTIWHYLSVEHEIEIPLTTTEGPSSVYSRPNQNAYGYSTRGLLEGKNVWCTAPSAVMLHADSVTFAAASDAHCIRRLEVATIRCPRRVYQANIWEIHSAGASGRRALVDWRTCGRRRPGDEGIGGRTAYGVDGYEPEPIAVAPRSDPRRAARARFAVLVREVRTPKRAPGYPGIAIIKAFGCALPAAPAHPPADLAS